MFDTGVLDHLLASYGYYAVFTVVMLESAGVPMPGETVLVTAAIYAGTRHQLDIRLVIGAAAAGAIIGDNLGFAIGRALGAPVLARLGPRIGLDARKQLLGQYLFKRFGGAIVFFGRFAALLRTYAAVLAGVNRLNAGTFFLYNAAGGITWAAVFGVGGYLLGQSIERVAGPVGYVALAAALVGLVWLWRFYKKHEAAILATAEREMAGATPGAVS